MRRRVLAWASVALLAAPVTRAVGLEFLHVEANEGGSSGGHAALRIGDATYHYQNESGLLRLAREDSLRFVHDYALLENRPIHVQRIEVSAGAERRVSERFEARLGAQRSQLDALAALRAERDLLALLERRARGEEPRAGEGIPVAGAGYFAEPEAGEDPVLVQLRLQVERERGAAFLVARTAALRAELAGLSPGEWAEPPWARLDADRLLLARGGFGARASDLAAAITALRVLAEARPLRTEALWRAEDESLRLDPDASRAVRAFADRLAESLPRLLDATRPDWGAALLVGMARLAALEASLRDGRLRVLDSYPPHTQELAARVLTRRPEQLPDVLGETRSRVRSALTDFVRAEPGTAQAAWSDLEDVANRHEELARAIASGSAMRVQRDRLVPARAAPFDELPILPGSGPMFARALDRVSVAEARLAAELLRVHGYNLVTHNCVSELFVTVAAAFDGDPALAGEALGGVVDSRRELDFVPFAAAASVSRHWRVAERWTIPSLRRARLAALRERVGPVAVALLEASPLTARSGGRGAGDSFFLFFTDEAWWSRPLFGALNLAAGAGETATGILAAPFDSGRTLLRGLEGSLMSLPELAFVNLRKGSYDWVPESARREIGVVP
jgi:hypothetical protein